MVRSRSKSAKTVVVHRRVPIEVTPLPFVAFDSVRNLDLEALARAKSARIEVGYYQTRCCRRLVHARVSKGRVTALELEPCKERAALKPAMRKIVEAAYREAVRRSRRASRSGGLALPVPVQQLPQILARLKFNIWVCVKICCFGHCIECCIDINTESPKPIWVGCNIDGIWAY